MEIQNFHKHSRSNPFTSELLHRFQVQFLKECQPIRGLPRAFLRRFQANDRAVWSFASWTTFSENQLHQLMSRRISSSAPGTQLATCFQQSVESAERAELINAWLPTWIWILKSNRFTNSTSDACCSSRACHWVFKLSSSSKMKNNWILWDRPELPIIISFDWKLIES